MSKRKKRLHGASAFVVVVQAKCAMEADMKESHLTLFLVSYTRAVHPHSFSFARLSFEDSLQNEGRSGSLLRLARSAEERKVQSVRRKEGQNGSGTSRKLAYTRFEEHCMRAPSLSSRVACGLPSFWSNGGGSVVVYELEEGNVEIVEVSDDGEKVLKVCSQCRVLVYTRSEIPEFMQSLAFVVWQEGIEEWIIIAFCAGRRRRVGRCGGGCAR